MSLISEEERDKMCSDESDDGDYDEEEDDEDVALSNKLYYAS